LNVKIENMEELSKIKDKVEDNHSSLASEIRSTNLKFENNFKEKDMALFSVFSNNSGTLPKNSFIGFDYDFIENRGNNFDKQNGIFTAPYKGIYEFTFSGNAAQKIRVYIQVLKNELEITEFASMSSDYAHISPSWICSLEKGDTIRLKLNRNSQSHTWSGSYLTFSGKLLSQRL